MTVLSVTADYMGMLATVMNALPADATALDWCRANCLVLSRWFHIRGRAMRYLKDGRVVIFAAGTGNPFFTTDTAAALRGME